MSILSLTAFPLISAYFQMQLLLETCILSNSNTLFDFSIPLAYLYWKCPVIITSKSITHFTEKTACFICHYSSQRAMILLSRYYVATGGTNLNYAKKVIIFITIHIFTQGKLDKIRRLLKMHTLCAFIFFIFEHYFETKGLIHMISVR